MVSARAAPRPFAFTAFLCEFTVGHTRPPPPPPSGQHFDDAAHLFSVKFTAITLTIAVKVLPMCRLSGHLPEPGHPFPSVPTSRAHARELLRAERVQLVTIVLMVS